ncbi:MAG TPA: Dabb family protein [Coxiellaceae bacterium]|nr:Dabb family protein [Coxiellaceae bacterium]
MKHVVLLKFRPDVNDATVSELMEQLASLKQDIPGILSFEYGHYQSHEGLNQNFNTGFIMRFDHAQSRDGYLEHPKHKMIAEKIKHYLISFPEGVVAFDFE